MPILAADKLLRLLEAAGHEAQLEMVDEIITREANDVEKGAKQKAAPLCFVDFEDGYLEVVRADLVRLGLMSSEELVSTGDELDGEEWLCPKCSRTFEASGLCPDHQVPLVTFEQYAGGAKTKAEPMPPWLIAVFAAAIAAIAYIKFFKN